MAHREQHDFCVNVANKFPDYFNNIKVLDVGSLDINGSNRVLFKNCDYCGIDIDKGKNVDFVSLGHEWKANDEEYDTIISTECFEHDKHYNLTIKNIIRMLKRNGLFIFTCACNGRAEHGTYRCSAGCSPFTSKINDWKNYYKNLEELDIRSVIDIDSVFYNYSFSKNNISHDLYFYGFKKC